LAQHFCPNPLMIFGGALFTGVSHIQAPGGANVEDTHRVLMTIMGGAVAVAGVALLIWPGTCVGAISWIIALAALLFAAFLIFLALRLKRLKKRVDKLALLRSKEQGRASLSPATDIFRILTSSSDRGLYLSMRLWDVGRSSFRSLLPLPSTG
jgi:phosphate/sulfate permease